MGKKRANDTNVVEKSVEDSTPNKKLKKSENLASGLDEKEIIEQPKRRGRPKKEVKPVVDKPEVENQENKKKSVKDDKLEDRRVRSKKAVETKSNKRTFGKKKRLEKEIEPEESEKEANESEIEDNESEIEDNESEKEENELEKEEVESEDNKILVFESEEESEKEVIEQEKSNTKSNTSLKKFDFGKFADAKENSGSSSEEESKETPEVVKVVDAGKKPIRGRSKRVIASQLTQKSSSPTKPATKSSTKKVPVVKKTDKQANLKASPKPRKVSAAKKDKVEKLEEEEEVSSSNEQPVESVEEKRPTRQTRKAKNSQPEQIKSLSVDNIKGTKVKGKASKGKNSKLTEKQIEKEKEKEDLSDKEVDSDQPTTSLTSSAKKMNKKSGDLLKIISLNCAGIRAAVKKDLAKFLSDEDADIVCFQETKCTEDKIPKELSELDYHIYWNSSEKTNQSGVAVLSKVEPINITYGIGSETHDNEGRAITCEYNNFFLVNIYATNSSRDLVNLDKKREWSKVFRKYLIDLDKKKPVIACGDFNCAHQEIDLKNPKTNQKNAGFTPEERNDFSHLLKGGFFDSFRHLYPDKEGAYTFWSNMRNSRSNNVGWRLDYYILSERLKNALVDNIINDDQYFSDHCPITLLIKI